MAIYYKDSFTKANSTISLVEADIRDANNLINRIKNFKAASLKELRGDVWNYVRKSLDSHIIALESRRRCLESLASTMKYVNEAMINAMGDYDMIDTSLLEEQKNLYNLCVQIIYGNDSIFSEEDRNNYNTSLMLSTRKLINQIEKVCAAEKVCISRLSSLFSMGNSYKGSVEMVTSIGARYLSKV